MDRHGSADLEGRALALAGVGFALLDLHARTLEADRTAQQRFCLQPHAGFDNVLGQVDQRSRELLRALVLQHELPTPPHEVRLTCADGTLRVARVAIQHLHGGRALMTLTDITSEALERDQAAQQIEDLWYTVELNPQLPWTGDVTGRITSCTDRWLSLTGLTFDEAMGYTGWEKTCHPEDISKIQAAVASSMASGEAMDVRFRARIRTGEFRWMRAQAFPRRNADGEVIKWYGYTEDIHELVLVERSMQFQARHDALTGLPNRASFNAKLDEFVANGGGLRQVGLLLLDVDNFKDVNDVLGHDAGDKLLIAFSRSLGRALPPGAFLARIGGDEFAVLVSGLFAPAELEQLCDTLFAALRQPVDLDGRMVEYRCSVGGACYPNHGQSPTELFKNADIALYEAKAHGRGRFVLFDPAMKQLTQRRVAMVNLGREAIEHRQVLPFYQVQVDLSTGRPIGFEALLRRRDSKGRIALPASIEAAFGDAEVAEALGDAMLDAVLQDITDAGDRGIDLGTVAINFSTAEFRSDSFVDRLVGKMARARVRFDQIAIEVTESVFLGRQAEKASQTIVELDRLGFAIALDDFGTGYASLLHLRQLPVDMLKIDMSFIRNILANADDRAIVGAIINLGQSLGLDVLAEGIESADQLALLRALNLRFGQGYLFSRPMPIADACALMGGAADGSLAPSIARLG